MVEPLGRNGAFNDCLQATDPIITSADGMLDNHDKQIEDICLDQRGLIDASRSHDQDTEILGCFKTLCDKGIQVTKSAVNIYKQYPFATSMVIFGIVSAVMPATGLPMVIKSVVDIAKDKLLSEGIHENDAQTIIDKIATTAQEH